MHRLALFSRERLQQLTERLHLDFEHGQGFLVLLRSARELALAEAGVRALAELGAAPTILDAAGCRAIEPGLTPRRRCTPASIRRTTRSATAASSRTCCRKEAERAGARFRFDAHVEAIRAGAAPTCASLQAPHDARDEALRARDSARADGPTPSRSRARRASRASMRSSSARRSNRARCSGRSASASRCSPSTATR